MKKLQLTCLSLLLLVTIMAQGQTFTFPPITTPAGCNPPDNYTLYCSFSIEKIVVSQIYSDNGVTGSFAFEVYITITNNFVGTLISTGDFYNYSPALYSSLPEVPASITNTSNIIPLASTTLGNIATSTNPTYNGSASALGLVLNGTYTDPDTLALFGYTTATLVVDAPCIGSQNLSPVVILPVIMSPLKASVTQSGVALSWTTFSEWNHAGFRIERSTDAAMWQQIDWVANTSGDRHDQATNYSCTDRFPAAGKNYYRLVQTDKDGKTFQSNTVTAYVAKEHAPQVTVYPNPAVHTLTLQTSLQEAFHYRLYTTVGTVVAEGHSTGGNASLDIKNLANGLYVLRIGDSAYPVTVYK